MMPSQAQAAATVPRTDPEKDLKALFEAFIHYQNLKDMPGIQACLHEDSQALDSIQKSLEALLDHFTLQVGILDQAYGGTDGCYAYYRFTQKIEKISGPEFNDMQVENLIVFRQHQDGGWKIWNYLPLWMQLL